LDEEDKSDDQIIKIIKDNEKKDVEVSYPVENIKVKLSEYKQKILYLENEDPETNHKVAIEYEQINY